MNYFPWYMFPALIEMAVDNPATNKTPMMLSPASAAVNSPDGSFDFAIAPTMSGDVKLISQSVPVNTGML